MLGNGLLNDGRHGVLAGRDRLSLTGIRLYGSALGARPILARRTRAGGDLGRLTKQPHRPAGRLRLDPVLLRLMPTPGRLHRHHQSQQEAQRRRRVVTAHHRH